MSFIAYSNETHTVIEVDAPHFDAKLSRVFDNVSMV